jgi:hypothetical protein
MKHYAMKTYKGWRRSSPFLTTSPVGSFLLASRPVYDTRLSGPESQSGRYGEEKNLARVWDRTPALQPIALRYTTELQLKWRMKYRLDSTWESFFCFCCKIIRMRMHRADGINWSNQRHVLFSYIEGRLGWIKFNIDWLRIAFTDTNIWIWTWGRLSL